MSEACLSSGASVAAPSACLGSERCCTAIPAAPSTSSTVAGVVLLCLLSRRLQQTRTPRHANLKERAAARGRGARVLSANAYRPFLFMCFEICSHCVAQAIPKLLVPCPSLLCDGITGMYHHTRFSYRVSSLCQALLCPCLIT